ncbi:MAG TPA: hypothetical protein VLW17_13050 [Thermoanaerobaculaceae bacterium]|nr:hypothetical protein [Thermoanaerobaculaceae bacterium]
MRSRWVLALLALSLAGNVALGTALWTSWRSCPAIAATLGPACAAGMPEAEMRAREALAASLCERKPDRAAIAAALSRLDLARDGQRRAAVERWAERCAGAGAAERAALATNVKRLLCPWTCREGDPRCAPAPSPGARSDNPARRGQS